MASENKTDGEEFFVAKRKPQILASLAAIVGAFALGTVFGWSSPALPSLDSTKPFAVTRVEKWGIASLALLGAAVACPIAGILLELKGRKFTIVIVSLPFCAGWLLIGLTQDKLLMAIGRFITGFCGGALSLAVPIYISEITAGNIGIRLLSAVQVAVTFGILFSYILGAYISWQWLSIGNAIFPLLLGVLMYCMPETPYFLLTKGKLCEASLRLTWLRAAGFSVNVDTELQDNRLKVEESVRAKGGRCRDFMTWSSFKCLLISLILMVFQQFSGVYAVLFYAVYIFRRTEGVSGSGGFDVNNAAIAFGCANVLATILSTGALNQCGRKRLIIISELIMAASLGLMGVYYKYPVIQTYANFVPIVCLMAYISAFSIGLGPVPFLIMREMFPLGTLGFASTITTTVSWALASLMTFYFFPLRAYLGAIWTFWTFAIVCIVGAAFILCIVPETKGKTPEENRKGIGKRGVSAGGKLADKLNLKNKFRKADV